METDAAETSLTNYNEKMRFSQNTRSAVKHQLLNNGPHDNRSHKFGNI